MLPDVLRQIRRIRVAGRHRRSMPWFRSNQHCSKGRGPCGKTGPMPPEPTPSPGPGKPSGPTPEAPPSRRWLLVLFLMLGAMWLWKTQIEGPAQPPIAYSQLFEWIREGKVESVVISG